MKKPQLTNRGAQRMFISLRNIDAHDSTKLAGATRLDIARNINRMMPAMVKFEAEVDALRRSLLPGAENHAANAAINTKIEELANQVNAYELIEMDHASLRLDDNPRITGEMVAALVPILKDFDSLAGAAEAPKAKR